MDEPRAEKPEDAVREPDLFATDSRGRQLHGWTNKLIWGDNKLILASLKNGSMREEIEAQGGLKLIYIDPPFDVGADFSMDIEIGEDVFTKKPNILEEIAYRDSWGKGQDSFTAMIYERLSLMRDLLSEDGSIYVHCDYRVSANIRFVLDEIFGSKQFLNENIWSYKSGGVGKNFFARKHDTIYFYARNIEKYKFNTQYYRSYQAKKYNYNPNYPEHWDDQKKQWYHNSVCRDVWDDIKIIGTERGQAERLDYPTQKPEDLIRRIIEASSNEGDLIADFFCGSGTTAAVAEKLGRKWIVSDLGKFGIHTTRKRMIGVQRQLKAEGKDYRAFAILNLGKYERQHFIGVNPNLREEEQQRQLAEKETAFLSLILRAYQAEAIEGFTAFHGKRAGRVVAIGPVNMPVTRLFVEEIILECRKKHITKVDILGFEFEMGLFPNVLDEARAKGIDIAPKYIPADVFDKRAVERNQVVFHDVAFIEVKPHVQGKTVAVELTDFSVFYSQDSIANAEATVKNKGSKIVVEKGQIVKVNKDINGIVTREVLTQNWTDWIDYWAVDFDYESKRELIRVQRMLPGQDSLVGLEPAQQELGEYEERWTGDYIFENEWQSFRTKKDRSLELKSVAHECAPGPRKIAVKVVDIFGNDTMTIISVNVGGAA
jgi:DNA modification methylase